MTLERIAVSAALVGSTLVAPLAAAQPQPSQNTDPERFRVPIHRQANDPAGGDYGVWASGDTYKVSFHDGMTFYPLLGPGAPENLPVRWQTTAMLRGGQRLLDTGTAVAPATWHSDLRFEYRFDGLTEAYDIRPDGVEQSFVLYAPPAGDGDLVVEGRLSGRLSADDRSPSHGEIALRDAAGRALVTYGAATAIDAAGRRLPMQVATQGDRVRLHVPDSWLDSASYPVVLDPLLSSTQLAVALILGTVGETSIGVDVESTYLGGDGVLVAYTRSFSANDHDLYVRMLEHDWSNGSVVFSDVTTNWSTRNPDVAFIGGPDRWAVAIQRDFATQSGIRVVLHDAGDRTPNSGTVLFANLPFGETHTNPAIGGTANLTLQSGNRGLLVYQRDPGGNPAMSNTSRIEGILVDANAVSLGTPRTLRRPPIGVLGGYDQERPDVSHSTDANDSWIVVFQELSPGVLLDDWDVMALQVDSNGAVRGSVTVGEDGSTTTRHCLAPLVDGQSGRHAVTFVRTDTYTSAVPTGTAIEVQRLDWANGGRPALRGMRRLASRRGATLRNTGLAFDTLSDDHWATLFVDTGSNGDTATLMRLGHTGGIVEQHLINAGSANVIDPTVAYSNYGQKFLLTYGTDGANSPVLGATLAHDPTNGANQYGASCGGDNDLTGPWAWAGSESVRCRLFYAAPNAPAVVFLSLAPAAVPLAGIGMPGCTLLVDTGAGFVASLPNGTNANGDAWQDIPLSDAPAFIGDFYVQWAYMDAGAPRPLKMSASQGLHVRVRP